MPNKLLSKYLTEHGAKSRGVTGRGGAEGPYSFHRLRFVLNACAGHDARSVAWPRRIPRPDSRGSS
jgi:hypothetical protein